MPVFSACPAPCIGKRVFEDVLDDEQVSFGVVRNTDKNEWQMSAPLPRTSRIAGVTVAHERVPFPSAAAEQPISTPGSGSSSSSRLTSSDKLSALPPPSSPPSGRTRTPNPMVRHSLDASTSLPSFDSPSNGQPLLSSVDREMQRATVSEASFGKGSPHQRVSFENDRMSPSPPHIAHNIRPSPSVQSHPRETATLPSRASIFEGGFSRIPRRSDPVRPAASFRAAEQSRKSSIDSPTTRSETHSRAASPLRIFQWSGFHRTHSREEPFVPVDPFQLRLRLRSLSAHSTHIDSEHRDSNCDYNCEHSFFCCLPKPITCTASTKNRIQSAFKITRHFLSDTLPRQVYLHLLLRLPSLYFTRIARIFEDAEVSRPDVQRMIDGCGLPRQRSNTSGTLPPGVHHHTGPMLPFPEEWTTTNVSPALVRFKHSWEFFIDSLMREWKTLNLVSALLLSAILAMFQTAAANDPVIRTAALLSLICAIMSLSYGCIYIVRFGTMRSMYKATRWAEEARKMNTLIWWNVWVLLAMPAVWLAWSMILFVATILSFVWRTGSTADPATPNSLPPPGATGPRVAITAVFVVGMIYFALIIKTLKRYGRDPEQHELSERAGRADNTEGRDRGRGRERRHERGRARERRNERESGPESGLSAMNDLGLTNLNNVANNGLRIGSSEEIGDEKGEALSTVQEIRGST
ncbi:hypothetical protein SERLA73DRAFT_70623 [Serpula lacrymans var. lacrymans S7.3]|uniref:Uncharacterized protein n=2 Tax=Serpula lacrymans var. lacrymans TaxID=341189 RepID=F8PPS0_SERL3|nr:uncharacterized protein SERLADRAFT_434841 [Serpula lacrymans var. lacrymans S7.9]EGO01437.1 hypothetical protein SERLA73DRAFT_70623 [Serpula lacrymans var. lacrymans S7.3]EGO27067.1 hypothetical protein SERLADRAFT_434841 [Serpula lacrymans var. lacrymans S7.9]